MDSIDLWKLSKLFLLLMLVNGVLTQLKNQDVTIGVYLDNTRVMGFKEATEKLVKTVAKTASSAMERGSMTIQFLDNLKDTESTDLFGIIAVASCVSAHAIAHNPILSSGEQLYIAVTDAGCERINRPSTITIPLIQGSNDIVQLLSDLRVKNTLTWTDIIVILDETVAKDASQIMEVLSRPTKGKKPTSLLVTDLSEFENLNAGLSQVFDNLGPRLGEPRKKQFLAIVSKRNVDNIQKMAKAKNLNGPNFQWFYATPDTSSVDYDVQKYLEDVVDGDNIAFAYNMSVQNPTASCNNGYDCTLEETLSSIGRELSKALGDELELFEQVSEEEWEEIKPSQGQRANTIMKIIMNQQETLPVCMVCNQWGVKAVEIQGQDKFNLIDIADWRPTAGLSLFDDIFPHVTGGFRGRVLLVTSVDYPPWQIFSQGKNGPEYTGLIFQVLKEIGIRRNFTFAVKVPPDNLWGNKGKDGKFNGMIKVVQDKEVLLGAAAFTLSAERMTAVNFTTPLDREPYTYMIAKPTELSRVLIFIEPFANDTWIWIGVAVLLMGPILYIIHSASPYYDFHGTRDSYGLFNLQNCSWYCYGAILQQGGTKLPVAHSGRLLVSFWWVFVIIVVTTYSGNLVAFLTFPQIESTVSTLQDLLDNRGSMSWGYVRGTVLSEYFKNAEGKFKEIGEYATVHERQSNELLEMVRTKEHAYIEWKTNLQFAMLREFNRTNLCDYALAKEEFYFEKVAMILPQDSPYKQLFDNEIKRLQESGLIQKWKSDFWPQRNKCSKTAFMIDVTMRTVSMSDMQGSFFILVIGFIISVAIIFGECIVRLINKSTKSNQVSATSTRTMVKSLVA